MERKNPTNKKTLTDEQKRTIKKIVKTAAVVGIAAYAGYKLYQNDAFDSLSQLGRESANDVVHQYGHININDIPNVNNQAFTKNAKQTPPKIVPPTIKDAARKISEATGIKLKTRGMSMADDLKQVNPEFDINERQKSHYNQNCSFASMAYVMRRMGLDVKVGPNGDEAFSLNELPTYFKGAKVPKAKINDISSIDSIKRDLIKSIEDYYGKDMPNGACGVIGMLQANDKGTNHTFAWEKVGNGIRFIDPQSGGIRNPDKFCFVGIIRGSILRDGITFSRLDHLEIKLTDDFKRQFVNAS